MNANRFDFAFFLTALHITFFSLSAIISKLLLSGMVVENQLLARALFAALWVLIVSRGQVLRHSCSSLWPMLLARGVLGFCGMYGTFYAFSALPVSFAMMIISTTPLWVMFMGSWLLKEHVAIENVIYALLILVAIYCFSDDAQRNDTQTINATAVAIALAASISAAAAFLTIRKMAAQVGAQTIVFWFALCCIVGFASLSPLSFVQNVQQISTEQCLLLGTLCVFGLLSDLTKTKAYQYAPAWWVSILSVLTVAVSAVLAWWLLGEAILLMQWWWMGLMMAVLAWTIYRHNVAARRH
ncbi:DMT family transporter [Cardiobacteriaceae bacterium TAE3-ERU3]|nr:DMT family transporter [Cardiobacteriaceae bacterium TAE3-ERU3]